MRPKASQPVSGEKRGAPRVSIALTAHARIGNRHIRDTISDLSSGGLYLKTRQVAKEGTPVRVALALPYADGPRFCTLVGNVARVDRDGRGILRGLGVSFAAEEINAVDRDTLLEFIAGR